MMGKRALDYSRRNFDRDLLLERLVEVMRTAISEAVDEREPARSQPHSNYVK
jgi:hypothetical protein